MGQVVGTSKHCGHALTYKGLNAKKLKVVCSLIRPAATDDIHVRAGSLCGESNNVIQSRDDIDNILPDPKHNELIGSTFLMDAQKYGNTFRACIVKMNDDHNFKLENNKYQS
jgi:hypothetical protein